jgi:hypothetical protein
LAVSPHRGWALRQARGGGAYSPNFHFGFPHFALARAPALEYQYAAGVRGFVAMPIRPLLEGEVFGPEDITAISAAFEDALKELRLV